MNRTPAVVWEELCKLLGLDPGTTWHIEAELSHHDNSLRLRTEQQLFATLTPPADSPPHGDA